MRPAARSAAIQSLGQQLAQRVAALPEAAMRVAALAQGLGSDDARSAVLTLESLIRGALRRDAACVSAYDALLDSDPVVALLGDATLERLLQAALATECVAAVQWLRVPIHGEPPRPELDPTRLVHWGLREMTLGDRRALARRARGDQLTQVGADPDGGVIANLLNNPRTTEAVVLGICARRPQVDAPLRAVIRAPRWVQRYPVKRSLIHNPYLELRFGLNLLVYLDRPHLAEVRQDSSLGAILRLGAQRIEDLLAIELAS